MWMRGLITGRGMGRGGKITINLKKDGSGTYTMPRTMDRYTALRSIMNMAVTIIKDLEEHEQRMVKMMEGMSKPVPVVSEPSQSLLFIEEER